MGLSTPHDREGYRRNTSGDAAFSTLVEPSGCSRKVEFERQ